MRTTWLVIGWTAVLTAACGCPCDPDAEARELAGDGAVDCGFVELGADPTSALDCAETAIANDVPFHIGLQRQGRDSEVRTYLAGRASETIWILGYDGDPSGGSGSCATLVASRCGAAPSRTTDLRGSTMLACASTGEGSITLCGD